MTHPTVEELFADMKHAKCPMCGHWMQWSGKVLYCYDHQENVHLVISANGMCIYQGKDFTYDCTYDQLVRMAKLKAFI